MTKLRGLVLAGLIGLLAVCAPPAQAVVFTPAAAAGQLAASAPVPVLLQPELRQAPPGPVLDPANTNEANTLKTRNKAIAAGVAAVLLLLVVWGRRVRSKKRKKRNDQAAGK
ncbi:MAG: hypothetical protein JWQ81_4852 [Amycolatopsis sp.]|jgi:hypothetical protein|uniref:hypothetical protein n=1 Tax=Amycolatopsis sp. TaxID=37632 RepID=UPI00262F3508|nr:hypothetical protein [Amycolatopsis sp.]MCU1684113.1 hypothetical protein [Amycolatopsis sp.]